MSNDADKKLRVSVDTTGSDPSGAKKTADALEEVTHQTKKHGEASKEAEGKIGPFNFALGETRRLMQDLQEAVPGLRELVGVFLGLPGAIGAILVAFLKWREEITEVNKKLDEQSEKLADPTFLEAIQNRQKVLADLNSEHAKYVDNLANQVTHEQALANALSQQALARHANFEADQKIAAAQLSSKESDINSDLTLTPEQKAARIAGLRIRAGAAAAHTRHAEAESDIQDLQSQLGDAQKRAAIVQQQVEDAEKAHKAAELKRTNDEAMVKALVKQQTDLDAESGLAVERKAEWEKVVARIKQSFPDFATNENLQKDLAELDEKIRAEQNFITAANSNRSEAARLRKSLDQPDLTGQQLSRAQKEDGEIQKILRELPDQIAAKIAIENAANRSDADTAGADAHKAFNELGAKAGSMNLGGLTAGQLVMFNTLEQMQRHHEVMDTQQKAILKQLEAFYNNGVDHTSKFYQALTIILNKQSTDAQKLDALTLLIESAHARINTVNLNTAIQ